MDDPKNQNKISGTLRTLKTDISIDAQDRLQQAGNFVQARPEEVNLSSPAGSMSGLRDDTQSAVNSVKQDVTPVNPSPDQPLYQWAKPKESPAVPHEPSSQVSADSLSGKPGRQSPSPITASPKSTLSVLDDSLDISLEPGQADSSLARESSQEQATKPLSIPKDQPVYSNFNTNPDFNLEDKPEKIKKSFSVQKPILLVGILLVLIGAGVYAYTSNNFDLANLFNPSSPPSGDTPEPDPIGPPDSEGTPLIANSEKLSIEVRQEEAIRNSLISLLNQSQKNNALIEVEFTQADQKIQLSDFTQLFGVVLPAVIIEESQAYWTYVYNQQGIYKLAAVVELKDQAPASSLVSSWGASIPRDMAGFSLSSTSRIVNAAPELKTNTFTNDQGQTFINNYYNYTSNTDSIDVSTTANYIVLSSSQETMEYLTGRNK